MMSRRHANAPKTMQVACLLLLLGLAFGTAYAHAADAPRPGLLWNKTGLPATFPLQVKTNPGRDFVMTLTRADTGTAALAAYIEGGTFFRVLVPPGTYRLRFDYGTLWHDEEKRFADPQSLELEEPLTFEVRGIGRKAGHLVDLTTLKYDQKEAAAPQIRKQSLCQIARREIRANCLPLAENCRPPDDADGYVSPYGIAPRYDFSYDSYTRLCD